jgi:hypothetical protein
MSVRNFGTDTKLQRVSWSINTTPMPVESNLLAVKVLNGRARLAPCNYRLLVSCVRAKGDELEMPSRQGGMCL